MQLKTVRDIEVKGKRIIMRVDYNVSLGQDLKIADDTRIRHTIPTIKYLLSQNCTVFLCAHLGQPTGGTDPKYSLAPVAKHLEKLLGRKVNFVEDYLGNAGNEVLRLSKQGSVTLLENTRFFPGEKKNDPEFSKDLAKFGEVFVNDAFGTAHREDASIVGVPKILPAVAGFSFKKEVETILAAVENPKKPLVVILGGAKVSDKIAMLYRLIERADAILIGGGMANTFLCAKGYPMGRSYCELGSVKVAKELLEVASKGRTKVYLPSDVIVGDLKTGAHNGPVTMDMIPVEMQALDIGPETQVKYGRVIAGAGTIVWNGPMGVFEVPQFAVGTDYIFHALTQNEGAFVVVGGGDTLAAIQKQEHLERIDHISTGGGAMLELIEKGTLPGIEALVKAKIKIKD